ncbi:MAG TPA: chemotaxis protein CheA [Skermanella sp.]|jgi:two-component system, chemotaxis family, sensor kinase CheA|nr:chemotaxis protein CheA [Skermanella sp.]
MNALLEQFLLESRDLIAEGTRGLIALERSPEDGELVVGVFRVFHTLKGSSGVFGIQPMTRMLHAAEDMLAAIRDGRTPIDPALIDTLLECLDQTARWLDELEVRDGLSDDADGMAAGLIRRLRGDDAAATAPPDAPEFDDPGIFSEAERSAAIEALRGQAEGTSIFRVVYQPDPRCFFNGDDPLKLIAGLPGLAALRISPQGDWPALETLDPFRCDMRIDALAIGEEAAIRHAFRLVADQVRIAEVPLRALSPQLSPGPKSDDIVGAVLAEQRLLLASTDTPPGEVAGRWGSAAAAAANALRYEGGNGHAAAVAAALAEAVERHDPSPLFRALDQAVQGRQSPGTAAASQSAPSPPASRSLRVEEQRVDRLFALVGEMIVAKNTLGWLAGRTAEAAGAGDIVRPLRDLHALVERLTRDMHDAVVRIRMVPVGQVFDRFPRLVRDLSLRLGKPVDLLVEGEGTSADKTVVEALFEPLLHLVRNSLDHGIEPPEMRRGAGKPERATVTLRAFHAGDRVVVEVSDDGGGIDIAAVGRKAVDSRVLGEDELGALSEAEAARLIFAPGLSTMDETSDLSGRGVGMAAVRMAIERIGGAVGVETVRHRGTTIRLELPLTLALLRIVTVSARGRRFGVPLDVVAETIRLSDDRIRRIRGRAAFTWREQVVPLHPLGRILELPEARDPLSGSGGDRLVLVVDAGGGGGFFGLEVDGIGDRLEVALRPMDGLLGNIPAYLGTTLQGDGQVLLILNPKELPP